MSVTVGDGGDKINKIFNPIINNQLKKYLLNFMSGETIVLFILL